MSPLSLKPLAGYRRFDGPILCVILDGVGIGKRDESDGVYLAHTPVLDQLMAGPRCAQIKAHGLAVGMPSDEDMGNSEVGHNTLGAGRIFPQGAKLAHIALQSGALFEGEVWKGALQRGLNGDTIHFLGLLSDGNVHSHINHLLSMLDHCAAAGVQRVRVHVLLDGRDVGERSALGYLDTLEAKLAELRGTGKDYRIASGGGRMVTTMDRYEADWSIVERGWKAHVLGEGRQFASAKEAVQTYYDEDPEVIDQYLDPFVIAESGEPVGQIQDGDAVICFNFRGDRAIEISRAFEQCEFPYFDRKRVPHVYYAGMTLYDGDTGVPSRYLVQPLKIEGTMSEYLCAVGLTSYAISETQKFGHVTYFWNGNKSGYVDEALERYVEVPSDRVPFDQRPWMKAAEITDEVCAAISSRKYRFIRLNYANGDMVGHTGNPEAIRIAVESVDLGLGRLLKALKRAKGAAIVLADHGNADCMFTINNGKREPHVAHTLNPVPFILADYGGHDQFDIAPNVTPATAGLSNVAATLMNLLGYEAPADYDPSLIRLVR